MYTEAADLAQELLECASCPPEPCIMSDRPGDLDGKLKFRWYGAGPAFVCRAGM
jgi:hypothetical protein